MRIEKLVSQANSSKKNVDEETLNTITIQIELDKTAEEFRKTHKERRDLIKQWETIIDQMQKRDNQIEASAQVSFKNSLFFILQTKSSMGSCNAPSPFCAHNWNSNR